ncbi:CPBP family intramembrane metalloprotease [Lactobacillus panisapium]|uniref:CPBP family intramembrane glutamic endopeptidase n=1 Tax=Lactobacillus panisapium TaxID=2012495 RepID=UPI001C6A3D24|nr:CPBP family intramembrane glutamic endopeptidase [Lactobacillus panisapium]QYN59057.1 CPBP family intramembrane metalloprotease [Lactobacillus panisapium]
MKTSKTILGSIMAFAFLAIGQMLAEITDFGLKLIHCPVTISAIISGLVYFVAVYYCVKLLCQYYLHLSLSAIGVTKFHLNLVWGITAFILPVMVISVFILFGGYFKTTALPNWELIMINIFYGSFAAGFVEELVFRGVILNLLSIRWNRWIGGSVTSLIFASMHIIGRKLSAISILQLLIACTLAGIMFVLIETEQRTIWNNAVIHSIWNLLTSALVAVNVTIKNDALITFIPNNKNFLYTGGDFGMESSLIALVAYLIVILLAVYLIKQRKHV